MMPVSQNLLEMRQQLKLKRKNGHVWLMRAIPDYELINGDHAKIIARMITVMCKL
jgi:hypothetical protein